MLIVLIIITLSSWYLPAGMHTCAWSRQAVSALPEEAGRAAAAVGAGVAAAADARAAGRRADAARPAAARRR
jgi:hypothetical protein